jgi:hypothetical protein
MPQDMMMESEVHIMRAWRGSPNIQDVPNLIKNDRELHVEDPQR